MIPWPELLGAKPAKRSPVAGGSRHRQEEPSDDKTTRPTTPAQIRELLWEDSSRVSEAQLIALIVGKASRFQLRGEKPKTWSCAELGEELYAQGGGALVEFVRSVLRGAVDFKRFGIGGTLGERLLAAAELAERWRFGFRGGGKAEIRPDPSDRRPELAALLLEEAAGASEAELLIALLGQSRSSHRDTDAFLAFFKDPEELMESLTLDLFRPYSGRSLTYVYFEEADLTIHFIPLCRLIAAIELAKRYCRDAGGRQRLGTRGRLGASRRELLKLLDPERRLDRRLRAMVVPLLRSHPELTEAIDGLERLAADAGARSYEEAVEAQHMFEELLERPWTDPAAVVGPAVPYRALLSIAEARIARGASAERSVEVRELLQAAERSSLEKPVASFIAVLRELRLSREGAATAFEQARRLYFEEEAVPADDREAREP